MAIYARYLESRVFLDSKLDNPRDRKISWREVGIYIFLYEVKEFSNRNREER